MEELDIITTPKLQVREQWSHEGFSIQYLSKNNMSQVDNYKIQGNVKVQYVILKYLNCDYGDSNRKQDKGFGRRVPKHLRQNNK